MAHRREKRRNVKQSKSLTWALRHGAEELKLNMGPDGFVAVSELLKLRRFRGFSLALIQDIVSNCPKQRFGLKQDGGHWFVRANQGHTTKRVSSSALLTPILSVHEIPNGTCIHGTYRRCLGQILATGLSRMKRNNIHFTPRLAADPTRPHSGFRASCDTLVYVDVAAVLAAGIKLFISSNGVILSPGNRDGYIPARFFAKIVDRRTNKILHSTATAAPPALPPPASGSSSSFLEEERAKFMKSGILSLKHAPQQAGAIRTYLTRLTTRLRSAFGSSPESVKIKINEIFHETVHWDVVANKPERTDRPIVGTDVISLMTRLVTQIGNVTHTKRRSRKRSSVSSASKRDSVSSKRDTSASKRDKRSR